MPNLNIPAFPPELRFREGEIPSKPAYILWLDVMGSKSAMLRSHAVASNFVAKMHAAIIFSMKSLSFGQDKAHPYPMGDGSFIAFERRQPLEEFIARFMTLVSQEFLATDAPLLRFMVRGAIAYGAISTGADLESKVDELRTNEDYSKQIIVGRPLTQAFNEEKSASPFGVAIHESARAFAPTGEDVFSGVDYLWLWKSDIVPKNHGKILLDAICDHLCWCQAHSGSALYEPDRAKRHLERAKDYFTAQKP